jgi:hypothetical protein
MDPEIAVEYGYRYQHHYDLVWRDVSGVHGTIRGVGLVDLVPYLAGLVGGGGVLGVTGKWLVEREKTKREQIRRSAEITMRAIELTFPRQRAAGEEPDAPKAP